VGSVPYYKRSGDWCRDRECGTFRSVSLPVEKQIEELLKQSAQREAISDELADVLFFLLRISQKYDFDLSDAFLKKLQKNKAKYPVEKAKGQNTKYTNL
jgi:uncharacterized protein YabN with tetrapyrrole methylase and pyrophosphatase domain